MGKVTGFLEIDRRDRRYAPASDRIRHYKEFVIPLSEEATKDQAARCMNCGIPYCHNGCPVNNQIPDWNDLVYNGNWEEASRNLHSTNNFPEFTGRVCPAPCEASCTLNLTDQSVTIKSIECAIVDRAWSEGWLKPEVPSNKTGKKVAIVGSGPAGLAAAQQLARVGHDVYVFEKHARAGGLLRYGIPDFKMEKQLIERRVKQMEEEGVTFHYNVNVGVSMKVEDLVSAYDAVIETCRERARPVVLTAVTAILGVLAIAFGINLDFVNRDIAIGAPSTQWWTHLSAAIVFGLGFATILTLVVTPAALMMIANLSEGRQRRREARAQKKEAKRLASRKSQSDLASQNYVLFIFAMVEVVE